MTKKEYREKLISSVPYKDHRNLNRPDLYYYEDNYAVLIREYFKERGIKSLELNYSSRSKTISICSFISSGRLCYNYFRQKFESGEMKSLEFELPLENDLPTAKEFPTKMDAADPLNGKYYECKCDEITSEKHDYLSVSYRYNSALFKDFKINETKIEDYSYTDREGHLHNVIKFPASELVDFGELSVKKPKYKTCCYNELHFDLKQLICHLIALARVNGHKDLIYVIFVPAEGVCGFSSVVLEEMTQIKKSRKIIDYCNKHDISLNWEFVPILDVEDINYLETYK